AQRLKLAFPKRSPRFARKWRFTAATDSLARDAEQRFSGFVTPRTKRTTVRGAKLVEKFSRIALCRGCWDRTGRAPSRNSKPSNAANPAYLSLCIDGATICFQKTCDIP